MTTLAALTLMISIACRSVSELALHGKLKWSRNSYAFWGADSWWLKYKPMSDSGFVLKPAPNNWYYRFFKIKYKERFPLSTTALVFLTDGMHLMQFFHHIFLAITLGLLTDVSYIPWVWIGIICVHAGAYKIFQK